MKKYIELEMAIELGKKQSCAGIIDGGDFCNISANMLRKIPAADVVEVQHGRWKWDGFVYDAPWQCSECGTFSEYESNYCPNCGAKMDKEVE